MTDMGSNTKCEKGDSPQFHNFEIMAPVGSWESLAAAFQAGAGSIYFGVEKLNMRSRSASHFTLDDLREIASQCDAHGVKSYLTLNTVMYGEDIPCCVESGDFGHYCM